MLRKVIFFCDRHDANGDVTRTEFPFLREFNSTEICFLGSGQINLVFSPSTKQMKFQTTQEKYINLIMKFGNALAFPLDILGKGEMGSDGNPRFAVPVYDDADRVFAGDFGPELFVEIDFEMLEANGH